MNLLLLQLGVGLMLATVFFSWWGPIFVEEIGFGPTPTPAHLITGLVIGAAMLGQGLVIMVVLLPGRE